MPKCGPTFKQCFFFLIFRAALQRNVISRTSPCLPAATKVQIQVAGLNLQPGACQAAFGLISRQMAVSWRRVLVERMGLLHPPPGPLNTHHVMH